jgi:5-methylcytosine-specific restriction enzyme subunit McrC
LAELILDATTPDPIHAGPTIADGFLIDMAVVFEAFLTRTFEAALHRHGHRSAAQQTRHRLDEARRITLKPDITVYRRGRVASVIDAKYKTLTAGRPSNEDLYQLTAYCTALGVEHGHLVYAAGTPAATRHEIRQTAITVTAHALDLTAPASELIACIDRIALAIAEPATATAARFGDLAPRPG